MTSLSDFYEGGPKTWNEAFPPICVKPRFDNTLVTEHILPKQPQHNMAMDPRPSTRICSVYYSLTAQGAPPIPESEDSSANIMPPGGAAGRGFPFAEFQVNVDNESNILRLDEQLTRCSEKRYIPVGHAAPPSISFNRVPGVKFDNESTLSPKLTYVSESSGCRKKDDDEAWNRSSRLFFNPTKYDRTNIIPTDLYKPSSTESLQCK